MSQPTLYTRQYNFTDYQTANPSDPLPGDQVDAELNAVKQTADQICANLALIQRDDGALMNDSVGMDQLKPEVSFGLNSVDDWAIGIAYEANDGVWYQGGLYRCLDAHTSTVFATDLAAERWSLILDVSQEVHDITDAYLDSVAQPYVDAAAASASAAATSATNAATSASSASTSATTASTAATNASNSATSAATSATNASTSATAAATSATNAATSETNAAASAAAAAASAATVVGPVYASTTTGTSTAYAATFSPAITSYVTGVQFMSFILHTDCGASATLNANGIGAKALWVNGAAVTANALRAGPIYTGVYDGTRIHVIGGSGSGNADTLVTPVVGAGSSQTLNYSNGNVFDLTGTASTACTLSFSNLPASGTLARGRIIWRQDGTTGGATLVWPAGAKWLGQPSPQTTAPTFTTTASYVHEIDWLTVDGGTTIYFYLVGGTSSANASVASGTYLATCSQGKAVKSSDGTTWAASTTGYGSGINLKEIATIAGRFVILPDGGTDTKSTTDGTTYSALSLSGSTTRHLYSSTSAALITYTGNGNNVAYSTAGTSFTTPTVSNNNQTLLGINGNDVIQTGENGVASIPTFSTSTDGGQTWSTGSSHSGGITHTTYTTIGYANGYWLFGNAGGEIGYKTTLTGTTITAATESITTALRKFKWTGTKIVAFADSGQVANVASAPTSSFTNRTSNASGNFTAAEYSGGVLMAVTDTGEIIRSTDNGDTWAALGTTGGTPANPFAGSALNFIVFLKGKWWTGGANAKIGQSSDGGLTFQLIDLSALIGTATVYNLAAI
jgi:hypothetical protein